MNQSSERIYSKDVINSVYLTKLQREPKKKRRVSRISPFRSRRVSEPILSMEDFERRFQFNNLVRAYNHLLVTKKSTSSSDEKDNSKLILPMIKEIKIKKHGMNDTVTENEIKYNESENDTDNKTKNFNNSISDNIDTYNSKKESKDKSVKSKLNKSDATLTQSQSLNKSTSKSKLSLNYDKERKRLLLRNLSNDSLFAQYKVRYLIALKDYQDKTKLAKQNYQNELEKIRNEILPKSKNEEFFKAYEFDFNSNKMQLKLKNQFNFFQYIQPKKEKVINPIDKRLLLMLKKLKINKERKSIFSEVKLKSSSLKPSQRSIQNMLRKEKRYELKDEIKIDSPNIN
jgi:hypothetical protein